MPEPFRESFEAPLGRPDARDWDFEASTLWVVAGLSAIATVAFGDWLDHVASSIAVTLALVAAFCAGARVEECRLWRRREVLRVARDLLFLAALQKHYIPREQARAAAREIGELLEETEPPRKSR